MSFAASVHGGLPQEVGMPASLAALRWTPLLPGPHIPDMPPSYSRLTSLTPGLLSVSPPPYQDAMKVDTLEQILTSARETQLL